MLKRRRMFLAIMGLILVLCLSNIARAKLSVGVKKGDWIEYSVTYIGVPTQGHDISWARMEVLDVQDTSIDVNSVSRYSNGSTEGMNSTLNLANGRLIDNFIIPANLSVGDTFYAQHLGNVTINKAEQHNYADATRPVLYATVGNNTYVWDQATGVSVEGTAEVTGYSMHTIVEDTNIWQPQEDSDLLLLYLVAVSVVIVVGVIAMAVWNRKKKSSLSPNA